MRSQQTRRCFCRWAILSGGAMVLGGSRPLLAGDEAQDLEAMKDNFFIKVETRQAGERARLFHKLVAKYGKEILAEVETDTIESTRDRLARADLAHRDLSGVKAYLWDDLGKGFQSTCVIDTPTKLAYKVTKCFLADEMRKLDAGEIGLAFYCAYDIGFCEGLNPKIEFTRTKTLMAGDACCNHTYELKE